LKGFKKPWDPSHAKISKPWAVGELFFFHPNILANANGKHILGGDERTLTWDHVMLFLAEDAVDCF